MSKTMQKENDVIDTESSSKDKTETQQLIEFGVVQVLPTLEAAARRYARNEQDAEDLIQQTCLRAMEKWKQLRDVHALKSWLLRIMHNTAINNARGASREFVTSDGQIGAVDEATSGTVQAIIERESLQAFFDAFQGTLTTKQRELFVALLNATDRESARRQLGMEKHSFRARVSELMIKLRRFAENQRLSANWMIVVLAYFVCRNTPKALASVATTQDIDRSEDHQDAGQNQHSALSMLNQTRFGILHETIIDAIQEHVDSVLVSDAKPEMSELQKAAKVGNWKPMFEFLLRFFPKRELTPSAWTAAGGGGASGASFDTTESVFIAVLGFQLGRNLEAYQLLKEAWQALYSDEAPANEAFREALVEWLPTFTNYMEKTFKEIMGRKWELSDEALGRLLKLDEKF